MSVDVVRALLLIVTDVVFTAYCHFLMNYNVVILDRTWVHAAVAILFIVCVTTAADVVTEASTFVI